MAPGFRPVVPSNRAKPLPIIGRASRRRHDPSMMTFLRFMPSRSAPRLNTFRGDNFFGGCVAHQMRLMRMKCRPCSISCGLTPARFGEIREILHPFREGSVSIGGTALGAGIDRHSMSEGSSSDVHNGPRRCVPAMNSIGRTPRKARPNGFCPVFPPFLPVYGRPPPEKSMLLQDVSASPGKTTEHKRRKRWKRSDDARRAKPSKTPPVSGRASRRRGSSLWVQTLGFLS